MQSLEERLAGCLAVLLRLLVPAIEPRHVGGRLDHVFPMPSRNRNTSDRLRVVANRLLYDLFESVRVILGLHAVHLVDTDDELFHSKSVRQ